MTESITLISKSPEVTRSLGETLGKNLQKQTVIALTGDLGSGKTVFVQGLARGLSVPEKYHVTSPTYTLINEYPGRLRLIHADLYRLSGTSELHDIGFDEIYNENSVISVEWAERAGNENLEPDIEVRFQILDDMRRELQFFFYGLDKINLIDQLNKLFQKHIQNNKR